MLGFVIGVAVGAVLTVLVPKVYTFVAKQIASVKAKV